MKKIIVLLTILCASILTGMQKEQKGDLGSFEELPEELRQEIAKVAIETAIATSTTVDEAIKAIQTASMVYSGVQLDDIAARDLLIHSIPNNLDQAITQVKHLQGKELKNFTKLVHILADKFDITTARTAATIGTPIAQTYLNLGKELKIAILSDPFNYDKIIELIKNGADVNFSILSRRSTPLHNALSDEKNKEFNVELIKILLDAGAKPTTENLLRIDARQASSPEDEEKKLTIKQLLQDAMNKQ